MPERPVPVTPQVNLVLLTNIIYALHALSVIMGLIGSAFVITTFLTGWPSIIAIIINYSCLNAKIGMGCTSWFEF